MCSLSCVWMSGMIPGGGEPVVCTVVVGFKFPADWITVLGSVGCCGFQ